MKILGVQLWKSNVIVLLFLLLTYQMHKQYAESTISDENHCFLFHSFGSRHYSSRISLTTYLHLSQKVLQKAH